MVRMKPLLAPQQLRISLASITTRAAAFQPSISAIRASSSTTTRPVAEIPSPTPFIPDVQTFLTVIGRGLSQHASKFPTWEALFSLTSDQLRELGVEPPRTRRYLLQWRQRFRLGQYGVGGDLQHVADGKAELRILESDRDPVNPHKYVVNVPTGRSVKECTLEEMSRVRGYKVQGAKTIVGPYALPLKGGEGVQVAVTEGMWEDKRGRKIDGGERRRTEVRYKKRIAERREMRERGEL
ncbi:IGR protein motif-domain-containing protein [Daldinia sp. FL1419]|nr:IGR protein motif-domain-containing protein [Daldinia sp. FL1419]